MGRINDLTGKKFNRLTAVKLAYLDKNNKNRAYWVFKCDCGNEKILSGALVKHGTQKSCGCLQKEAVQKSNKKHGEAGTKLYYVWTAMKQRCNNINNKEYKNYGGRGIKVCEEWEKSNGYITFRNWALQHGYKNKLTLDRIDNDGDYTPDNCRWITARENCNNKSNNHILMYKGQKHTLSEWEDIVGLNQRILWKRLKRGWSIEKTLTTR